MTRADAYALLCEYVSDLSLRRHGSHQFARYALGKPPSPDDPPER